MSADNGYLVRKNAAGVFVLQMYFASDDEYPSIDYRSNSYREFATLEEAITYHNHELSFDSEYGLHILVDHITYSQDTPAPNENEDPTTMSDDLALAIYDRNPFQVTAVQVTEDNMEDVAEWCGGHVRIPARGDVNGEKYIKVDVRRPLNVRQTQAFVGSWVLQAGTGFKVYTANAFGDNFTYASELDGTVNAPPRPPLDDAETPVGRDVSQDAAPVEVSAIVPLATGDFRNPFQVDESEANS